VASFHTVRAALAQTQQQLAELDKTIHALPAATPGVAEKTRSTSKRGPARTAPAAKTNGGGGRDVNVVMARQPAPLRRPDRAGNEAAAPVKLVSGTVHGHGKVLVDGQV